jgi:hypothetical protein
LLDEVQHELKDPRSADNDDLLLAIGTAIVRARMHIHEGIATCRRLRSGQLQHGGHAA